MMFIPGSNLSKENIEYYEKLKLDEYPSSNKFGSCTYPLSYLYQNQIYDLPQLKRKISIFELRYKKLV